MSRIKNWKRQARELGRFRAGEMVPTKDGQKTRPAASETWILTSETREYLDYAAALLDANGKPVYGGTVEPWQPQGHGASQWRLVTTKSYFDALLAPGDPISQYHESWTAGGCQRRCDGETELLSDKPCVCYAKFGEDWHELNRPPKGKPGTVCDTYTRINVICPNLPDIGFWRIETKGYWAGNRIPGAVDYAKSVIGPAVLLPARFHIVQRTRTVAGKTSQYIEIVVQLQDMTMGQLMAGDVPGLISIGPGGPPKAIDAAPLYADATVELIDRIGRAVTREEMMILKGDIETAGLGEKLGKVWSARAHEMASAIAARGAAPNEHAAAADGGDADAVWTTVVAKAGKLGWSTAALTVAAGEWLTQHHNTDLWTATAEQMAAFGETIQGPPPAAEA